MRLQDISSQKFVSGSPALLNEKLEIETVTHLLSLFCVAYEILKRRTPGNGPLVINSSLIETEITEELYYELEGVWARNGPECLRPIHEKPNVKRKKGPGKTPTIDLCFRSWNREYYFGAECKILENKKNRYDQYIDEGMMRYISGNYSREVPEGAMIGYILSNNESTILEHLGKQIKTIHGNPDLEKSTCINGFEKHYLSIHERMEATSPFKLHHLFFCFN